jgi:hypothetical protein
MIVDVPIAIALFNLFITLVGGVVFVMRIEGRQNVQDVILDMLDKRVDSMSDTLKLVAGQAFEIAQLSKTVEELRSGVGWKHDPLNRKTVEGEY